MTKRPQTLLGFDYGTKRIGVAVGQELTRTATALETVAAVDTQPNWEAISRLVKEWNPQALVVGLPLNDDGSEHKVSRAARRFGEQLRARFGLPVHSVDERLSSHAAEHLVQAARPKDRRNKKNIDKLAAQVILESWLASGSHEG